MKRIFISHPRTGNPALNRRRADAVCRELLREGALPVSPLHLFGFMDGGEMGRREAAAVCFRLIDLCDALYVYGDSPCTRAEVRYAWSIGKPVSDRTVTDWDGYMRQRSEVILRG